MDGCIKSKRSSRPVAIEVTDFLSTFPKRYDTTNARRGHALIFNHYNFTSAELKQRDGTKKDRDDISNVLNELDFYVHVYDDLSRKEVLERLKKWSRKDHSKSDCLVVVVMTHGDQDCLYARDKIYRVNTLWKYFTSECRSLQGKPKMFFIQACRGDELDEGVVFNSEQLNDMEDSKQARQPYSIPPLADLLVMYSMYDGHISWRNNKKGSWFIQSLCKELKKSEKRDLLTILTGVSRMTAYEYASENPDDPCQDGMKQMPCLVSTLTKSFYFTEKMKRSKVKSS